MCKSCPKFGHGTVLLNTCIEVHSSTQASVKAILQQVMSAQGVNQGQRPVLEGENAGPAYGRAEVGSLPNGVAPAGDSHTATGMNVGRTVGFGGDEANEPTGSGANTGPGPRRANETTTTDGNRPATTSAAAACPQPTTAAAAAPASQQHLQGVQPLTQDDAQASQSQEPRGEPAGTTSRPSASQGLPQHLQSAVQQLSQQRASVVQAVQARASRALQGVQGATTPGHVSSSGEDGQRQGLWSVTRISEV